MLGLDTLELDSDFLARYDVGSEVDITKGSRSNLSSNAVLVADTKILCTSQYD